MHARLNRSRGLFIALSVALGSGATGCTTTTTHYAAVARAATTPMAPAGDDVRLVDPSTRLKPGVTIALYPPDACTTTSAAPSGSEGERRYLQMQCGVLMSALEKAAATEGYNVVSWQLLKGDPLARARELRVDYLLEVDELSVQAGTPDANTVTDIRFYEVSASGRVPLTVNDPAGVAGRCKGVLVGTAGASRAQTATLAVKMTGVEDGRAKWFYRHTVGHVDEGADTAAFYGAEKATPTGGLVTTGVGVLGVAGGFALNGGAGTLLAVAGAGVAIVGAIVTIVQLAKGGPAPEQVLCNGPGGSDPYALASATSSPSSGGAATGTGFQFSEDTQGSHDAERERRAALIQAAVADFTGRLRELRAR